MSTLLSRRELLRGGAALGAWALASRGLGSLASAADRRLNVLFIAVDDLRPDLGCYGVPIVKTPNIDALAARGTVFTRAYCQQAVCSPSRTSLLTGLRPDTTRIYDLKVHFRRNLPDALTLPQHFRNSGYHTQGLGKIFHPGLDDPRSWSVPHWAPKATAYAGEEIMKEIRAEQARLRAQGKRIGSVVVETDPKTGLPLRVENYARVLGPPWECADVADTDLPDGMTADKAIATLRKIKDRPFFLAVGFMRPHLPFVAPRKYYDMYPPRELSLPDNPLPPKDSPPQALAHWGELRGYMGMPKNGPVTDKQALQLIRGYYACASYTDAQIGRVLNELDRLGLRESTVVVLWGDHGWQLGEHGEWCKHTNFEVATRSPLILSVPGQKRPGAKTEALAEFVDIYPTLTDVCGLPTPGQLEGVSVAPLLDDPSQAWKTAAFSQYPRGKTMGYSMRTDRYRYTEWMYADNEPVATELYDHVDDPDENFNIAGHPENRRLVSDLSRQLHAGWKAARPVRTQ